MADKEEMKKKQNWFNNVPGFNLVPSGTSEEQISKQDKQVSNTENGEGVPLVQSHAASAVHLDTPQLGMEVFK